MQIPGVLYYELDKTSIFKLLQPALAEIGTLFVLYLECHCIYGRLSPCLTTPYLQCPYI